MDRRRDMDRRLVATGFALAERLLHERGRAVQLRAQQPGVRACTWGGLARSGLVLASFCLLAGCVDSYAALQTPEAPPQPHPSNIARRPGVSPSGATVALASFTGGPGGMGDRLTNAFEAAAKGQNIVIAEPAGADYLVRGYLDAVPESDGTAVTYVLDVFDSHKHRTQRVEDKVDVKVKAANPWSVIDDHTLAAVAAKSAAELAAVLTNTPEAILASAQPATGRPATVVAQDEEGGRTIVVATPPVGPPEDSSSAGADLRSAALNARH
jgi:hypothetical protein